MDEMLHDDFSPIDIENLADENSLLGIITVLGELKPAAIITEEGVARLFNRHVASVKRAVQRGELPPSTRLFGQNVWTVGTLIRHIESRLDLAAKDVEDILPRAEDALRQLQALGRSGKTLANYAEALAAFCDWCVQRGYLAQDPLKSLKAFDTTPQTRRRAMTPIEISQLLQACASHRRLLLETAFLSGLRANELRHLTLDHLDLDYCGLRLDAVWTKNRPPGFQPLPSSLMHRLHAFCTSGEPARL
jgi:integrase